MSSTEAPEPAEASPTEEPSQGAAQEPAQPFPSSAAVEAAAVAMPVASNVESRPGLAFERVSLGYTTFDWYFPAGLHTLAGEASSGTEEVFALAHGLAKPKRGRVLLDGVSPHQSLQVRRSIASVSGAALPDMGSARALLRASCAVSGQSEEDVVERLESWGRGALLKSRVSELAPKDRTAFELALALHHRSARLVLLWEPFTAELDDTQLRAALAELAQERPVLVFSATAIAPPLSGSLLPFGRVKSAPRTQPAPAAAASLWLACERVEDVARHFLQYPDVGSAEVLPGEPGLLRLRLRASVNAAALCHEVLAFAHGRALGVRGLRLETDG